MANPALATPSDVLALTTGVLARHFSGAKPALVPPVLTQVEALFAGRYPGYVGCDMLFHDLTHTCDATLALLRILDGHLQRGNAQRLTARDVEVTTVAALLHDSGYFRESTDTIGTGAKYTLVHVARSVEFAAKLLAAYGLTAEEKQLVRVAILCTGLNVDTARLDFRDERERFLGYALGTGDMLGQLAAPQYPDRLPGLYLEFVEGGVPGYDSATDLMAKTRQFWNTHVQQLLETQWHGVYRELVDHYYQQSIELNLQRIEALLARSTHDSSKSTV